MRHRYGGKGVWGEGYQMEQGVGGRGRVWEVGTSREGQVVEGRHKGLGVGGQGTREQGLGVWLLAPAAAFPSTAAVGVWRGKRDYN